MLMVLGVVTATTQEYVFEWWRNWVEKTFPYDTRFSVTLKTFVNCPICQSFWVSLATVWLFPELEPLWFAWPFASLITTKIIYTKILAF